MQANYLLILSLIFVCGCMTVIGPRGESFMLEPNNSNQSTLVNCDTNFSGQNAVDCDQGIYSLNKFQDETGNQTNGTIWIPQ